MPVYVAMLRGINVGGHKKIKMDQLRAALEKIGLEQVKTYIQSGNVVFKCAKISPEALSKKVEKKILEEFGHSVSVITRGADEIKKSISDNPFLKERGIDEEKLHVTFMSGVPAPDALKQLETLTLAPDRLRCLGKELYFYLPNGMAESVLMKKPVDRLLGVVTTTRNWRTVNTLQQMCTDCR
ncbi:MAG TPA: DUF1697 domain-containing protein [Candidatus Aquilonibacter sp.]|jgi:uncharacterized protein (DUF1697 family)|nr:DUF1697 domain-containing protein [Candidatus Aquilonibacter sp.]